MIENIKYIGGTVVSTKDTWNWVASVDFTSLYPSILMTLNIGADTLVVDPPEELLQLKEKYFLRYFESESAEEVQSKNLDFVNNVLLNDEIREEVHRVLEKYNVCATPNGIFFKKEYRSLVSEVIDTNLIERKRYKKMMKETEQEIEDLKNKKEDYYDKMMIRDRYDTTQMALKILLNSLYGILSMEANQFAGHKDIFSNSVTSFGQIADLSTAIVAGNLINAVNNKLKTPLKVKGLKNLPWVSQADTDSAYICVEPFVKLKCENDDIPTTVEKIDQFLKKILLPKLDKHLKETLCYFFNAKLPEKMNLDREIIADKFFSIGNKNYYTRIWDNEGVRLVKNPKIKTVGIAVKKANCPKFFRETVMEAMILLLDEKYKEIRDLQAKYKREIQEADILDICISVNINSLDYQPDESGKLYTFKDGKKLPAPINSRAGIVYNNFIEKNNIPMPLLEAGKANYIFLKEPNPCKSNVIAFKDPRIFEYKNLKDYIDYDIIFEKFFTNLLNLITEPLNISIWEDDSKLDIDEW